MNPLVSVIVPTYNGEVFVRETLDSVLAQDYAPLELIVCDDGSSDGTMAILAGYEDRIRLIRQQNQGVAAARNNAALVARGEFLAFLDHDDVWESNLLSTLVPLLVSQSGVDLAYADAWIIDRNGERRGRRGAFLHYAEGQVFDALLRGNFIPVETTLLRAKLFFELGGCDTTLRYLEDYELCLRIARRTSVALHREPLARYRIHERNLSHDLEPMLIEWLRVIDTLADRVGALTDAQALVLARERDRLTVDLAWRALRRGDLAASDAWIARAGQHAQPGKRARVRCLRAILGLLPRALGSALLRCLPRRRLYGVQVEARDDDGGQS